MSNRPEACSSSAWPRLGTVSTPESPGPPGLTNSEPIRCSGWLARWRITDKVICPEAGLAQSNGTGTVAHSSRGPHDVRGRADGAEPLAAAVAVIGATVAVASATATTVMV